jgi:hypothetical protein
MRNEPTDYNVEHEDARRELAAVRRALTEADKYPVESIDPTLLAKLQRRALIDFDGHLTILRFTTNWRVGFITPDERGDIDGIPVGRTFEEAANAALVMTKAEHWQKIQASREDLGNGADGVIAAR